MDDSFSREQTTANHASDETLSLPGLLVDVRVSCDVTEGDGVECEQSLVPLCSVSVKPREVESTGDAHRTESLHSDTPSIAFDDSFVGPGGHGRAVAKGVNWAWCEARYYSTHSKTNSI